MDANKLKKMGGVPPTGVNRNLEEPAREEIEAKAESKKEKITKVLQLSLPEHAYKRFCQLAIDRHGFERDARIQLFQEMLDKEERRAR